MAHQLAIAKASFSAGLLRPDPTSVPRDDITAFHSLLERVLPHCSPANIQTCKSWLLQYVVSSSNRSGMLGKYLVALSSSFGSENNVENGAGKDTTTPVGSKCSGKRKRLHILYLVNDLFHHTKYHPRGNSSAFVTVSSAFQPYIVELIGHAAAYHRDKNPKHHRRLDQLLEIWAESGYYSAEYVDKLREAVRNSASIDLLKSSLTDGEGASAAANLARAREAPYVMPASHGDSSTPYYDLPAGNFVPHIIPDSETPIRPDTVKPLQFLAGPADPKLVTVLKNFLKETDRIYGTERFWSEGDTTADFDELGQVVLRDEATGEIVGGDTYYGWSREFCKQMKMRRERAQKGRHNQTRSQSRSVSPPRRRRRYVDSVSSRSRSRSRSRGPHDDRSSYSRSRSHSRQSSRRSYHGRRTSSYSQSRSRSRSYSPRPAASPPRSIPQPPSFPQGETPPLPPHPFAYSNNSQKFQPGLGSGIPPPPPNYTGPWPPPPPPLPQGGPPGLVPVPPMPPAPPVGYLGGHHPTPGLMNPALGINVNMNMGMGMGMVGMPGFGPPSMSPHQQGGGGPPGSYVPPPPLAPPPPSGWGQPNRGGRGESGSGGRGGYPGGGRGWY